ncbi:hypothetical protein [Shinella sumterensis]|uniref:hypothetical protein n=1 Tax=Shinella sumterensis TaxID=1967501 RepID=UPI003F8245FA
MFDHKDASVKPTVLILSSRTWGELGNRLSAGRLKAALEESERFQSVIHESFEDYSPYFAAVGQQIRDLSQAASGSEDRNTAYCALIDRVRRELEGRSISNEALGLPQVTELVRQYSPDIVIGTKGLISHIVCKAVGGRNDRQLRVVNFVTNDGLLTLPIHISAEPDLQIVQTEEGKRRLLEALPELNPSAVRVAGPLIMEPAFGRRVPLRVGIFINRGGEEYWPLLEAMRTHGEALDAQIICAGNDELLDRIVGFAHSRALQWKIDGALSVNEYLCRLDHLAALDRRLFICKSAPSTVFEALARSIPVFAIDSGLPMERWVGDLLEKCGTGRFFRSIDSLIDTIRTVAEGDDAVIQSAKAAMPSFIQHVLGGFGAGSKVSCAMANLHCNQSGEVRVP